MRVRGGKGKGQRDGRRKLKIGRKKEDCAMGKIKDERKRERKIGREKVRMKDGKKER